jgi:hypothetical protein
VLQDVLFQLRGVHGVNQPAIRLANSQIPADLGEWLRIQAICWVTPFRKRQ